MSFSLIDSKEGRVGKLQLKHGIVNTPNFMPVGTRGCVKTLLNKTLHELGAEIILGNTYHLLLRPGLEIIQKAGGLHAFMNWDKPLLTDSGGFQVFSLGHMNKITDKGVFFKSHIDGSTHFIGPNESMEMQKALGSDIVMAFDECAPYPGSKEQLLFALEKTTVWAKQSRDYPLQKEQKLFGIVQGGLDNDLRERSAKEITAIDFDGYAIGGLSVGEPPHLMRKTLAHTMQYLPREKPRYLMGVGTPRDLLEAVLLGVDLFDCVMPTRNGRNGTLFTWSGKIHIKAAKYKEDFSPLDDKLSCYASSFSKAYVRHLFNVDEITGYTLATMQNIAFYLDFMKTLRNALIDGTVGEFKALVDRIYPLNQ